MRRSRMCEIVFVAVAVIWCVVIIQYMAGESMSSDRGMRSQLNSALQTMENLQAHNQKLSELVSKLNGNSNKDISINFDQSDVEALQKKLMACITDRKLSGNNGGMVTNEPTQNHGVLLKVISDNVRELWYSIESKLTKIKQKNPTIATDIDDTLSSLGDQQKSALIDIEDLNSDNMEWQIEEMNRLKSLVRKRILHLQNPSDCKSAKKLVCMLNKGCGFGCQIHHLTYCFMVAYGTERTLIINSDNWRYNRDGWESVFLPASETCTKNAEQHVPWTGEKETANKKVVLLPIVDGLIKPPPYLPLGIPEDIAPDLLRLHGNPSVWWVGQFMSYLLRPQGWLQKDFEEVESQLDLSRPIVGIQVRRTDKVGTEAAFHDISEYMKHVIAWFDKYDLRMVKEKVPGKVERRVYLATDDATVLPDARERYPEFTFISDISISESAGLASRYTKASLRGVVIDIQMLSKCNYLVCTFSSQVCRVAYELMQSIHPDASSLYHSLDDIYYYGGQSGHQQVAIYDHVAKPGTNEIDLKVGDHVGIAGNHWDGFSKGTNMRTRKTGLYPSYKTREIYPLVKYPTYLEANSDEM